jgi:hypothetical protein
MCYADSIALDSFVLEQIEKMPTTKHPTCLTHMLEGCSGGHLIHHYEYYKIRKLYKVDVTDGYLYTFVQYE